MASDLVPSLRIQLSTMEKRLTLALFVTLWLISTVQAQTTKSFHIPKERKTNGIIWEYTAKGLPKNTNVRIECVAEVRPIKKCNDQNASYRIIISCNGDIVINNGSTGGLDPTQLPSGERDGFTDEKGRLKVLLKVEQLDYCAQGELATFTRNTGFNVRY